MPADAVKACWYVRIAGHPPFAMVGERCGHAEALRAARLIWPDAEVA